MTKLSDALAFQRINTMRTRHAAALRRMADARAAAPCTCIFCLKGSDARAALFRLMGEREPDEPKPLTAPSSTSLN